MTTDETDKDRGYLLILLFGVVFALILGVTAAVLDDDKNEDVPATTSQGHGT